MVKIAGSVGIGDVVLYHFKSYKQIGSSETEVRTRPAIVTSFADGDSTGLAFNLHVFFEDRDFITPAQRELRDAHTALARTIATERRGVKLSYSNLASDYSEHADNTWSRKE